MSAQTEKEKLDLSAILQAIDKETENPENNLLDELIRDLILSSASEGISSANQNIRIDRIISIVSAREI